MGCVGGHPTPLCAPPPTRHATSLRQCMADTRRVEEEEEDSAQLLRADGDACAPSVELEEGAERSAPEQEPMGGSTAPVLLATAIAVLGPFMFGFSLGCAAHRLGPSSRPRAHRRASPTHGGSRPSWHGAGTPPPSPGSSRATTRRGPTPSCSRTARWAPLAR